MTEENQINDEQAQLEASFEAIPAYKFFCPKSKATEVKQKLRNAGFDTSHLEHQSQILYIDPVYLDSETAEEKKEAVQHDILADEFDHEDNASYKEITADEFLAKDINELWPGFFEQAVAAPGPQE